MTHSYFTRKSVGKLVSLSVEMPNQKEAPVSSISITSTNSSAPKYNVGYDGGGKISVPHPVPISAVVAAASAAESAAAAAKAHNEEQTMLWRNIAILTTTCEKTDAHVNELRDENEASFKLVTSAANDLYRDIHKYKQDLEACRSEFMSFKNTTKRKLKTMRKTNERKLEKAKRTASTSACDADMEVFKYIDTLRCQIDELRATTETQRNQIADLSGMNSHLRKIQEELSDLNDLYDDDYHRFCRREDDFTEKISDAHAEAMIAHTMAIKAKDAAEASNTSMMKAIESCNNDIYRLGEQMKIQNDQLRDDIEIDRKSNEYWVECELKSFKKQELANINSQIANARSYADTKIAGDLRQEFADAIVREITFENKVSAQLVQTVNDELTDMITRSNEIHSWRHFQIAADLQQQKDETMKVNQEMKQRIGVIDAELSDVIQSVDFINEDIESVRLEAVDTTEKLNDDMDHQYQCMKRYVRHKFNSHLRDEHPLDSESESEEEAVEAMEAVDAVEADVNETQNCEVDDAQMPNLVPLFEDTQPTSSTNVIVANPEDDETCDHIVIMMDENDISSDDDEIAKSDE